MLTHPFLYHPSLLVCSHHTAPVATFTAPCAQPPSILSSTSSWPLPPVRTLLSKPSCPLPLQVATQLERTKEELAAAASAATHFTLPPWAQEALTTAKDAAHTAYTQASALAGQAYTQAAGLAAQGVAALQGSEAGAKLVEGVQQLAARVEPLAAAAKVRG